MPQSRRDLPAWALEASLGIFVHWGPYSVPAWAEPTGAWGAVPPEEWFAHNAYAEWYANTIRIEGAPAAAHQLAEYGGAPYEDFLDALDSIQANAIHGRTADVVMTLTRIRESIFTGRSMTCGIRQYTPSMPHDCFDKK